MTPDRTNGPDATDYNGSSQIGPVTVDELFDILSHPGNRYVLTYLLLEGEPVSIVELVQYVLEVTEPPADLDQDEFSGQLLNRFIETILPALDDSGFVEYDRTAQMVTETEMTPLTLPYLRAGLQQTARSRRERTT
jgi:DNA-binding transcriptional ArsR family regulator